MARGKIGRSVLKRLRIKPTTYKRRGKTIHRKGYMRRDVGAPGRGKQVIPPLKAGELTKHGFSFKKSARARRRALAKSVREDGYIVTKSRMQALAVFFKRTKPEYSMKAKNDFRWLVKTYGRTAG